MEYNAEQIDLPYLGESLETMIRCPDCGYRHTDFVLTETKDPTRLRFSIRGPDAMSVRVVRSASGTVRIPELGILIEPGVASEAFITNVEGVLVRVERILHQLRVDAEDDATRDRIDELVAAFDALREGTGPDATLILEDPFGNSAILDDAVEREIIPADEAAKLQTGMHIIDPAEGDDVPNAA